MGMYVSNSFVDHVKHHVVAHHWHSTQAIVDHGKDVDCIIVQLHELIVHGDADVNEGVMAGEVGGVIELRVDQARAGPITCQKVVVSHTAE